MKGEKLHARAGVAMDASRSGGGGQARKRYGFH